MEIRIEALAPMDVTRDKPLRRRNGGVNRGYVRPAKPTAEVGDLKPLPLGVTVIGPAGAPILRYEALDTVHEEAAEGLREALGTVRFSVTSRSVGLKSKSRTFGYLPRIEFRQDYCHVCALHYENVRAHGLLCEFSANMDEQFRGRFPVQRAKQYATVTSQVLPNWRLGDTSWTTGIVNYDTPLHYHKDAGNYDGAWSCMLTLKHETDGGHLAIPEIGYYVPLDDKSVLMFPGGTLWHGVTPIKKRKGGHRYTVVYYCLKKLRLCKTPEEELEGIKQRATERERKPR